MPYNIRLSDWLPWSDRGKLPIAPGVYAVSRENGRIAIYIGRTWGREGIRKRIAMFHRSATTGKEGHAGGVTFNRQFGADVSGLFVAAYAPLAINPDQRILRPYLEYAERRLIWEHVEVNGALPPCNSE